MQIFFFLLSKNIWFIRNKKGGFIFNNFSNGYYRKAVNLLEVYFFLKYACTSFISHLISLYNRLFFIFFLKLKVRGLGYRIKRITSNLFRFFIGTTNYYYSHIPFSFYIKARRRRMIAFSNDKKLLSDIFIDIIALKKLIPYKLRGFFLPRQIVLMKPGKKRF